MTAPIRLALCAGCIAFAVAALASAQSVYSWKDAKGVTHYSDSPPPKGARTGEVRNVPVPPAPPAPVVAKVSPPAATTIARAPVAAAVDPVAAKAAADQRAAACKRAQENLTVLQQTNAAVGVDKDGDGKNDSVLTAEERTSQTANMQAAVQANCAATP